MEMEYRDPSRRGKFIVVLGIVLLYVVLYSFKLQRMERELTELTELARRRPDDKKAA